MSMIVSEYTHVFDGVQFGIDLKAAREKARLSQTTVGQAIGKETSAVIASLERATYDEHLLLRDFMKLCQLFDLHPFEYFDLQKAETIDIFRSLG